MGRDFPQAACGIVLNVAKFGEADKLVTLYCRDLGRITAIAKGAFKSKKRFVNKLEPYSHLSFFYQPPRNDSGLFLLKEAELLNARIAIRLDYRRYICATYFCELLLLLTREHDPDANLYTLTCWALDTLNEAELPVRIMPLAVLNLLCMLGYQPELTHCSRCHQPIRPDRRYLFLAGGGGLLCTECQAETTQTPGLSVQTIRILAGALSLRLERLQRLHLNGQNTIEAVEALHAFTLHLLQRDIHSYPAFRQLIAPANKRLAPATKAAP